MARANGAGLVLCGVDASWPAVPALHVARGLARLLDARLALAHVVAPAPALAVGARHDAPPDVDGDDLLEAAALAEALDPGTELHVLHGAPAVGLATFARSHPIELIVVGVHGRGSIEERAGSVPLALAVLAPCPLVIAPRRAGIRWADVEAPPRGPVVCGIDGSANAREAAAVAADLAEQLDVPLHLVHVAPPRRAAAAWRLRSALPELARSSGLGADVTWGVERGDPRDSLPAIAEEADGTLIVLGARGESRAAVGSVTAAVSEAAACPVVVVPEGVTALP